MEKNKIKEKIMDFCAFLFVLVFFIYLIVGIVNYALGVSSMSNLYKEQEGLKTKITTVEQEVRKLQTTVELQANMLENWMTNQ